MTNFYAVQNDNKHTISVVLRNGPSSSDDPIDLTTASAVALHATPIEGGTGFTKTCTYAADATGVASVSLLTADLATAGTYKLEWQVTFADGTIATVPDPGTDVLKIRPELA